jgi:hypothetical protein
LTLSFIIKEQGDIELTDELREYTSKHIQKVAAEILADFIRVMNIEAIITEETILNILKDKMAKFRYGDAATIIIHWP